jgi:UDP-N-acetylmuramoylalanine--D-glutamate ligase
MGHHLVVGLGVTGAAVAHALSRRGIATVAVDDRPDEGAAARAADAGVELVRAPTAERLAQLVRGADAVVPAPGLPDHHAVFALAREHRVAIRSELDLAAMWDSRPLLAITGTDGKTTVVTLVVDMLVASGTRAVAAGNTEVPLVRAIDDATIEVFVVEASSFRLGHSERFEPSVATWLNFAPDHLDGHADLDRYEASKARIWRDQGADAVAIGNAEDPVVSRHLERAPARRITFGLASGDYHLEGDDLVTPDGDVLATRSALVRAMPHDVSNALAAGATALAGGASLAGARQALVDFRGLPHRVSLVGEAGGVSYYDDSKATAPHATLAALRGFESVVLIAGGRNKGLDLTALRDGAASVRAVVAIGDAAPEVAAAFDGLRPVRTAASMDEAVALASEQARPGDAVLLSPGCASFDWYRSYAERGDDFVRAVHARLGASA